MEEPSNANSKVLYHAVIEDVNFETELPILDTSPDGFSRSVRDFIEEISEQLLTAAYQNTGATTPAGNGNLSPAPALPSNSDPTSNPVLDFYYRSDSFSTGSNSIRTSLLPRIPCHGCKVRPAVRLLHRPMLFEETYPRRIEDVVSPVCGKGACTREVYEEIEMEFAKKAALTDFSTNMVSSSRLGAVLNSCAACGKSNGGTYRANDENAIVTAAKEMLRCSRCKAVKYCNAECQKMHWKRHKSICQP